MFKGTSKITALIIAMFSIISMLPASADDVILGNIEGNIVRAIPFMDGTYVYEGAKASMDMDYGVYYYNGKEDILLDDIDELGDETDDLGNRFGHQYAIAKDENGNDRLIDLLSGKIAEDSESDSMYLAQRKLLRKLKNTKRYGSSTEITTFKEIQKNTFGDIWYYYEADTGTKDSDGNSIIYSGYVNDLGNYIDCSKIANITLFNGTRTVQMDQFGESKKVDGVTLEVTIDYNDSNDFAKTLGQDNDYIYREIRVNSTGHKRYDTPTTDVSYTYFVQRISKAQGETEDGANLPKEVTSFELTQATSIGDADNAVSYMLNNNNYLGQYIVNGAIIQQECYGSYTARTSSMGMWTNKVTIGDTAKTVDVNLVRKTAYNTQGDILTKDAVTMDANGNLWCINKYGEIKCAVAGGKFNTVYKVDPEFNRLSVYDSNNLLAWEDSGDKFVSIQEGKAAAIEQANETLEELAVSTGATITDISETTNAAATIKVGFDKLADGTINFYDEKGNKVSNKWVNVGGNVYYLKADGIMATGWLNDNGNWYYLNTDGSMKIGWLNDNGKWYYIQPSGIMKTGWVKDNGKWYYLDESGALIE